jgi:ATP-dependent DNA helicase RecG
LEYLVSLDNETEWVEFKENNSEPEMIGEYISAISNSTCILDREVGYLVFGVNDESHEIVGTTFKPKEYKIGNQELENWLSTQLTPRIDFRIHEFQYEQKNMVIFEINAAFNTPVAFKGNFFIRVGSYKQDLNKFPEKARRIWMKTITKSFEDGTAKEYVSEDEVIKDIDYPNYFELMDLPLPENKHAIIAKLQEECVIIKNANKYDITNLGAILFAKNLKNFNRIARKTIRVIIYAGKDRLETVKEQEFSKGYAMIFEDLINYIEDKLPSNEIIEMALRREVKMYPRIAIRELVANALIHQDFTEVGSGPMMEIFNDRIEISNPGQPLINVLRLIDHSPQSRNEKLASLMRRMKICEERGSGIDKVVNAVENYQLPAPEFIVQDNVFKTILFAHKEFREMERKDKIRACYQHCCLKYVSNEIMTNKSLRERFNISEKNYSMVSRVITDSIDENYVKVYDPENKSNRLMKYVPVWA